MGSSSLRFNLFSSKDLSSICNGVCENIGNSLSSLTYFFKNKKTIVKKSIENHKKAFSLIKKILLDGEDAPIKDLYEIKIIGHRVVHGGRYFKSPQLVDSYVIGKIRSLISLAPIHNSINLEGILDCQLEFPGISQIAVFDTSFFCDLPEKVKTYPIPYKLSKVYRIEKYGFHGISHEWAYSRYKTLFGTKECKLISCHLGSGSSVCAIDKGNPIDISMGLTPLGGLMMGTRSGSIDPSVITYLISRSRMSAKDIDDMLNKRSGLIGVSEFSHDIRELIKNGDHKCNLALDMYVYRIVKYIGAYFFSLGGADSIVFTGGIGENSIEIRNQVCKYLNFLGANLDNSLNSQTISGKEGIISYKNSSIKICVIKTNEELAIATKILEIFNFRE